MTHYVPTYILKSYVDIVPDPIHNKNCKIKNFEHE